MTDSENQGWLTRRVFLKTTGLVGAAALTGSLWLPKESAYAVTDTSYVGINNGTGFNTDPAYVDQSISYDQTLGIKRVRMGMDGVDGYTNGAAFNWGGRDTAVNKYRAAGIAMDCVISMRSHVSAGSNFDQWKQNWDYFVRAIMNRYKGKIFYYIIDNETDLSYGSGQLGVLTPQQVVDFCQIAFNAARSIDSSIKIESSPTTSPETDYLRQMISLGVANYCDVIGVHAYGGQIDDGRLAKPWQYLAQYGLRKPVAISESGVDPNWAPGGFDGQEWRRRWLAKYYVALKRYGYDHTLLFDLDGNGPWAVVNTAAFNEIKNNFRNDSFANGGFEDANDNEHQWTIYYPADWANPPSYVNFVRGDAGGARSGSGYLRLNTGTTGDNIIVRRVAEKLTPGTTYTVTAWAYIQGGGTARLKALGYDHLDGDSEVSTSTSTAGSWRQLSLTVKPTRSWVVIELSAPGSNTSGQFVKFDDVSISSSTGGTLVRAINAGGGASGSFVADTSFNTGNQYSDTSAGIDTSGVSNPAPQGVYQTCRWNSSFTYTIGGLTAGSSYKLRLHFAELTWNSSGQRKFNVAVNGSSMLSNFDVFATAGAIRKAVVRETTTTANSSGQIVVNFTQAGADNPFVSGLEVYTA